jgi:cell division protease FtsH
MSDRMGPVSFGKKDEQIFLGREMAMQKNYSEATAVEIDSEIRRIVDENYARVKQMLTENVAVLHRISMALIEKENLTGLQVDEIMQAEQPAVVTEEATV